MKTILTLIGIPLSIYLMCCVLLLVGNIEYPTAGANNFLAPLFVFFAFMIWILPALFTILLIFIGVWIMLKLFF